jgi:thiamine-monophosphate kinase
MLGTRLHAMIDLSDGLGLDTQRLAEASRVAIDIHAPDIPLYPGVTDWHAAAAQGEDYELLFTSPALPEEVIAAGESVGVSMTRIGEVHEGADAAFIEGEHRTPATDLGFLH